jgi:hypothetical protein
MTKLYPTVLLTAPVSRFMGYIISAIIGLLCTKSLSAQAVSGIITDYNGYWKSSVGAVNTTKPDNNHNLLAFSYNGITYSTGVNDPLLSSNGETFLANDFWSLPVATISGTINGNTKVGLGEQFDGVTGGASNPPPAYDIAGYLTDGIKGLNIGTCIANLPTGSMTFPVSSINPSSIGDGVPDILVTQVADPSGSYDRYNFTDINGAQVGNYKDIVFTSIIPVGSWTADFYEASANPLVLTAGYTKTDRQLRLWAADLSEFGVTVSNYQSIRNFRIGLSGTSDVAFVAYSTRSFAISGVLPVRITEFSGKKVNTKNELSWTTQTETNAAWYVIEKGSAANSFTAIDSVKAKGNSSVTQHYSYTDKNTGSATTYYRLRTVDVDGRSAYNTIVSIKAVQSTISFNVSPNPVQTGNTPSVRYETTEENNTLSIFNSAGIRLSNQTLSKGSGQAELNLPHLSKGVYYVTLQSGFEKVTQKLVVN